MSCPILQLEDDPTQAVTAAAGALAAAGVVIFPTDTVYGLLAAIDQPAARTEIYELKHRPAHRPLALLVSSPGQLASAAAQLLRRFPAELQQFSAGRLTLILDPHQLPADALPEPVLMQQPGPVGLRCPKHEPLQALLLAAGGAVWATSVNESGKPPAVSEDQVRDWLASQPRPPALAVLSSSPSSGCPSRVVALSSLH